MKNYNSQRSLPWFEGKCIHFVCGLAQRNYRAAPRFQSRFAPSVEQNSKTQRHKQRQPPARKTCCWFHRKFQIVLAWSCMYLLYIWQLMFRAKCIFLVQKAALPDHRRCVMRKLENTSRTAFLNRRLYPTIHRIGLSYLLAPVFSPRHILGLSLAWQP